MRQRPPSSGWLRLGLAFLAAGCAGQASPVVLLAPPEPGPISGTVLDGRGLPLPDQVVAIGAAKTASDGDGRFSFPAVPAGYDLVIASPDGSAATVYQGLTRRDPIVTHDGPRARPPARRAAVTVTLAGSEAAGERWRVQFVSARAIPDSGSRRPAPPAPGAPQEPETVTVMWDGAETISGVVVAAAMRIKKLDIPLAMFAQQPVTLRDGETKALELVPVKAPIVRRPRPRVITPKEDPGFAPVYLEEYRLPGVGGAIRGPGRAAQPYALPDLRGFGLELCAYAFQWNPYLHSNRTQCGLDPSASLSVPLPSPPVFSAPAWDTAASPGLRFAWSAVPGAVYQLVLSAGSQEHSRAHPRVKVVTTRTTAGWPDLQAVGVGFPEPLAAYRAVVGVRGSYASIDELVGPRGAADPTPRDRWSAESKELSLPLRPPLGKEEAACKFRETVICDDGGIFRLSVMNRKIQSYPELATAVNIHCVRDCDGARAYLKAYAEFSAAHPGFDEQEPLPVEGPEEPMPPPEMFNGRRGD